MTSSLIRHGMLALAAAVLLGCAVGEARADAPAQVATVTGKSRPEFRGLYMGMPASEVPGSLQKNGDIGVVAGFLGDDYVEALVWAGSLNQLSIIYSAPALGIRPKIERSLTLQEAWRLHSAGNEVPTFGLFLTHLYLIDGIIDTRNLIVYRLRFPHRRYGRDDPPLFDPATRVERVIYFKDRPDFASNYQPIGSTALQKLIAERYRDAFVR
jgi:hypothetical protein